MSSASRSGLRLRLGGLWCIVFFLWPGNFRDRSLTLQLLQTTVLILLNGNITQQLVLSTVWGPVTTSLMHSLFHWLRVPECIDYKLAVLAYTVLHGSAPSWSTPPRRCRWSTNAPFCCLQPSRCATSQTAYSRQSSLLVATAQLWNSLPDYIVLADSLSTFQCQLKHYLFQQSGPD